MDKFISVNIDPTSREDHSVLSAVSLNWANSSQSTKVTRVSSIPGKNTFLYLFDAIFSNIKPAAQL